MTVLLQAQNVTRTLAGEVPVTLVKSVSVSIYPGEFVAIIGPSGSGKSSLMYLLGLLDRPTSGTIVLQGEDTGLFNDEQLAEVRLEKIGFVFQNHFLLPEFTALENVTLPMRRLGKYQEEEIIAQGTKLLADLGLAKEIHKIPRQLSGGQSQRVAIARALANNPLLILGDEPTGNLDTTSSGNVTNILRTLSHRHDRAVVIVTHDPHVAESCDRQIRIVDGEIEA